MVKKRECEWRYNVCGRLSEERVEMREGDRKNLYDAFWTLERLNMGYGYDGYEYSDWEGGE